MVRFLVGKSQVATALALVLLMAGCATSKEISAPGQPSSGSPASEPKRGGTLVFGFDSLTESFDPAVFTYWAGINTVNNVFDTLAYSKDGKNFEPGLATAWKISEDGKTYTFELRQGVKFHDGTPFNAEAVKFTYDRQTDDKHPYHMPGMTNAALALGSLEKVEVTGEYEVKVVLKQPNASQMNNLASFSTAIVSPEAVKKYGKDFGTNPVGTGPFKFEKLEKGQQIVLAANKEYWGGAPYLDRVIIRSIPEDASRKAALLAGDIDITTYLDPKDLADLQKNANLTVITTAANSTGYMGMNARHPALAKKEVRQAMCHAVNRESIIDVIFSKQAVKESGWMPPVLFSHDTAAGSRYSYDPEKAKQMLSDAGYPTGFNVVLEATAASHWPRLAELVQEDLRKVGITATINKKDASAFGATINAGQHDIFFSDWTGLTLDPDYFMNSPFHSSSARAQGRLSFNNAAYDNLVEQALVKTDPDERGKLYMDAQNILLEEAPMCFLYYNQFQAAMHKRVQGFDLTPTRNIYFKNVWLQ